MKKELVILGLALCIILVPQQRNKNLYTTSAEVVAMRGNIATLEDVQGNLWEYESDKLKMYGRYILEMDSCDTEDKSDDIIINIQ